MSLVAVVAVAVAVVAAAVVVVEPSVVPVVMATVVVVATVVLAWARRRPRCRVCGLGRHVACRPLLVAPTASASFSASGRGNFAKAILLEATHRRTGDLTSLDYAVGYYRQGLALCPPEDDDRRLFLDGLGYALRKRYDALGDLADLRECIELLRQAAAVFPPQHPGQMATRHSLSQALRAEHLRTGDRDLVREAAEVATAASQVPAAPVSSRIQALGVLGHSRATLGDWQAAADVLGNAVALLPRLAVRRPASFG
ncbi:hypothetical protein ABZV31_32345 [Streptomyces sp. NPDC005202]|uniref:hypothetical protein n=1 Tax=Streptomyces sp. NPDC005202 TaxID=3157021 RepID=UPI0033A2DC9D